MTRRGGGEGGGGGVGVSGGGGGGGSWGCKHRRSNEEWMFRLWVQVTACASKRKEFACFSAEEAEVTSGYPGMR